MAVDIDINIGAFRIKICLPSGVFCVDSQSGAGKSYLCDLIGDYRQLFMNKARAYNYDDSLYDSESKLLSDLRNSGVEFIVFDRYDLYQEKYNNLIVELSETKTILLDLKNRHVDMPYKIERAYISFTKEGIILSNDLDKNFSTPFTVKSDFKESHLFS